MQKVLGIETSCDDTSIALLEGDGKSHPKVLYHESFSSEKLLAQWGGVVPEIASRSHVEKLPLLMKALKEKSGVRLEDIDHVGVTCYPGLLGPLLSGLGMAKSISLKYKKAIVPVNHLYAHMEAIHIDQEVTYPYLGLLVSGGHSLYLKVSSSTDFEVLGSTIDDAAGEAFDKGGKLMGLSYPAGREIDELAKKGDCEKYSFPIGIKGSKDCNLSYSGLKTSLRSFLEVNKEAKLEDICASYQKAIVDALCLKMKYALKQVGKKLPIVVGGGVACNSRLRTDLKEKFSNVHFVTPKFCTDNGAMIANYALMAQNQLVPFPESLTIDARSRYVDKGDFV